MNYKISKATECDFAIGVMHGMLNANVLLRFWVEICDFSVSNQIEKFLIDLRETRLQLSPKEVIELIRQNHVPDVQNGKKKIVALVAEDDHSFDFAEVMADSSMRIFKTVRSMESAVKLLRSL